MYEKESFVPLLQINYDQAVNLHTTPQWSKDEPYNIYADPLFNSTQSAVDLTRIYYYHCDHLGTPQELSNSMAQVVWQGQYKVWGELKTPSVQQLIENSEIITNNLRFQGQYFDLETGLDYNRYRYYSPDVGRFISKDPIGLLGGLNGYQYAPNPISWVDPLGLATTQQIRIAQKENRERRQMSSSAAYEKHTKAKCREQAQKFSNNGGAAQYWNENFRCNKATLPQVTSFRNTLEKEALSKGYEIDQGSNKGSHYYIYDAKRNIGYNEGKTTQYMRVEVTRGSNKFHGHPISKARYDDYLKDRID